MKGALYLASIIRAYRQAIDKYWDTPDSFEVDKKWQDDLDAVSHRPYTAGLLFGDSAGKGHTIEASVSYVQTHTMAGIVRPAPVSRWETTLFPYPDGRDWTYIEARSRLERGMELQFLGKDGSTTAYVLNEFEDLLGKETQIAHPNTWIRVSLPFGTLPNQVIRTHNLAGGIQPTFQVNLPKSTNKPVLHFTHR